MDSTIKAISKSLVARKGSSSLSAHEEIIKKTR